jgi:hypothetical protein
MKILILEDNQDRIKKFKILFKNHDVYFCKTETEARRVCIDNKYTPFDILWLDHDLEGKIWEDSNKENTGYQFVKWMVDFGYQKNSLNYIHSMNPIGANLMLNYLKDNGYDGIWIPFHTIKLGE